MTITITKARLALSILAIALLVPATAYATHVFDDVPDGAFYADPVEWAADNSITTGKTPDTFAPLDNVTRGESVTFLQRYHDNVAQPGIDAAQATADANTATLAGLPEILFATIASDGEVYEGSLGLVSSVRDSTGTYTLTFDRDVFSCAATTADLVFVGTRDVTADPTFGGLGEVDVRVTDETGTLEDTFFNIIVACPPEMAPAIGPLDAGSSLGPND